LESDESAEMLPQLLSSLRSEIVEAQKTGADFLKWKLIGIAAVSSIALGLSTPAGTPGPDARLIVCLVPLICAYVDMVSLDVVIRIIVIAAFLRDHGDEYEKCVDRLRTSAQNPFRFAPTAIHMSSAIVNILIVVLGLYGTTHRWDPFQTYTFLVAGIIGLLVTTLLWVSHTARIRDISSGIK